MNRKPFLSVVFGTLTTCVLMILIGAHFDSDEGVFYFVINSIQGNSPTSMPATNNEFVLFYLFLKLKKAFLFLDVFSWGKIFFFSTALSLLFYKSSLLFKNKFLFILINCLFIVLFLDSFLLVNHVRTSTYLTFVALSFLFKGDSKKEIIVFYILIVFAILNRIEISILNLVTAGVISILFKFEKQMVKHVFIASFLAVFSLVSLWVYNQNYWPKANEFFKYERSLEQNKNFILNDDQIQQIFLGKNKNREDLIAYANGLLLTDRPNSSIEKLGNYIRYPRLTDYVLKNPEFKNIYKDKIYDVYLIFKYDLWYLLFVFLWLMFLIRYQDFWVHRMIRAGLFLSYLLISLLVLNLLVGLDVRTVQALFILPIALLLFVFLYEKRDQLKFMTFFILVLVLLFSRGLYTSFSQWKDLQMYHKKAMLLNEALQKDKLSNHLDAYVLDFTQYGVLPTKLFSYKSYNGQFLSMGHFENLPLFEKKKLDVFGEDYDKLPAKFDFIIQNNIPIYSNKEVLQFQQSYLEVVHQYSFELIEDDSFDSMNFPNLQIKKFKLIKN